MDSHELISRARANGREALSEAEKALEKIREFNDGVPLVTIIKCITQNINYIPKQVGGGDLLEQNVGFHFDVAGLGIGEHLIECVVVDAGGRTQASASRAFTRLAPSDSEAAVVRKRLPLSFVWTGGPGRAATAHP